MENTIIKEVEKIKQDILRLDLSFTHLKDKLNDITAQQEKNFTKIFEKMDIISKTLEGFNHWSLKMTMLDSSLTGLEKEISALKVELKQLQKESEEHIIKEKERERTISKTFKIMFVLYQIVSAIIFFIINKIK